MRLTVDDCPVDVPAGATVLDAVNRLGITLPQLCKDPDRPPLGACRTCLVHVEGLRGTPAACHLPARDGMAVSTTHPDAARVRTLVLDLTRSMLGDGEPRNGFGQLGLRHGASSRSESGAGRRSASVRCRRVQVVLRPGSRGLHPVRPLHDGVRRCPADRGHRHAGARARDEGRRPRRRPHVVLRLHVLRPVRGHLSDGRPQAQGSARADRPIDRDHVSLLRRGLRDRRRSPRGRAACPDGRRRPGQQVERGDALRQGALRHRLRARARSDHASHGQARRPVARGLVGRSPGRSVGRAGAPPRTLRGARQREGDQRGRLRHPEVLPRGHGHEQRGSLHAALPLAVRGGHARVHGFGGHVQLVCRLRAGRLPADRRG